MKKIICVVLGIKGYRNIIRFEKSSWSSFSEMLDVIWDDNGKEV